MKLILCSQSPRRKELLAAIGIPFEVRTLSGVDESYPEGLSHEETALYIAGKKAAAFAATRQPDELLITADTIVCVEGTVLGKPADAQEAHNMLRMLSGRTHDVVTAVCLISGDGVESFAVTTEVTFATLTDEFIDDYIAECRPYDKAGAYGIQERFGHLGIAEIRGNYDNVVGLPVQQLNEKICKYL